MTSLLLPVPVVDPSSLPTPSNVDSSAASNSTPMIVDLVLKPCIAGGIGARLTLQHDRAPVRHNQARPDQQHARLRERDLAIIDTDQPCPLRYEKETSGRAIEDVFGDLRRDLAGQI